jgi:hypothetical protein
MRLLEKYVHEILGEHALLEISETKRLGKLPMFINETYKLYNTILFNHPIMLVEPKNISEFGILQAEKHLQIIRNGFERTVVLVLENLEAFNRKRLVEKGINFIVPNKQLFLPELLIDLRESYPYTNNKQKREKLLPSAQFLLIYHIIHRYEKWKLEDHSFKEIAQKLNYTPMSITNAVENLKYQELIDVVGEKEKYIKFRNDRSELWNIAMQYNLLMNPVLKTVYVDSIPKDVYMLKTNASALPEYTDLNPSKQQYFAIEKTVFYGLQKSNALVNLNDYEGKYAIEVWKYDPLTLVDEMPNDMAVVDPLSLYLSLKDSKDERIEMALEQIIEKYIW